MSLITNILSLLVALEHFYIMYLETVATQSPATARVFGLPQEELERESVSNLFKNQGVYNGLIAVFSIYGSLTADKKIILKQGGLAILALLTFLF